MPGFGQTVIAWRRSWHCCVYDCFPTPIYHAKECSRGIGEGTSVCLFIQRANLVIGRTDLHMRDMLPCLQSPARVFVLLSILRRWNLRLKPLVVKIYPDKVTEHCCQVCILSMMFCPSDCQLCAGMCGKWLRNQETPRSTMWFEFTPTGQHGLRKIFFT